MLINRPGQLAPFPLPRRRAFHGRDHASTSSCVRLSGKVKVPGYFDSVLYFFCGSAEALAKLCTPTREHLKLRQGPFTVLRSTTMLSYKCGSKMARLRVALSRCLVPRTLSGAGAAAACADDDQQET